MRSGPDSVPTMERMTTDPQQPHAQQPAPSNGGSYGQQVPPPYGQPPQPYGQPPQPYGQAPYGLPPYGQPPQHPDTPDRYPANQPYQVPAHIPPGWPGRQNRRQIRSEAGPFRWMDLVTVLAYIALMIVGLASLILFIPTVQEMFRDAEGTLDQTTAGFAVNLTAYVILTVLALIACWRPFVQSLQTFRTQTWLKIGLIPGAWLATIAINALIVTLAGEPIKSENQLGIEAMTLSVPFPLMALVAVVMGPFVEEYLFRHLMIGKLSRHLNVWVCVVISIFTFALLHFVATGFNFNPVEVLPYLTLATVITLAYVFTGMSLAYAYILHVFNNLIALTVAYTLLPLVS